LAGLGLIVVGRTNNSSLLWALKSAAIELVYRKTHNKPQRNSNKTKKIVENY